MQSDLVGDIYFMTGIYAIINPNNEYYIGKSTNIKRRFGYYRSIPKGMPPKLKNSFEKFGFENHQKIILLECEVDELPKWELHYQHEYDCVENGLNSRYSSINEQNGKQSEETIRKRAESNRGKKRTQKTKDLLSFRNSKSLIVKNEYKQVNVFNTLNETIECYDKSEICKIYKIPLFILNNLINSDGVHKYRRDLKHLIFTSKKSLERV